MYLLLQAALKTSSACSKKLSFGSAFFYTFNTWSIPIMFN